jgi:spore maturation protein CgeB
MDDHLLRRVLGYPRFHGPPRVLVLDTGYYVIADLVEAALELGWAARVLPTPSHGAGQESLVAELLTVLVHHRPDFVLTLNHRGFDEEGRLAGLLARYEIPLASWFVDPPLPILCGAPGNVTPFVQLFCVERTALPWLAAQGYAAPAYLPSASGRRFHPDRIDGDLAARLAAPLTFVGQSWWGIARQEAPGPVRAAAEALVRGEAIADLDLPDRGRARAAYLALAELSLRRRRELAAALMPLGLVIYGDPGWQEVIGDLGDLSGPGGIDLRRQIDWAQELPAVFLGSQVNVNRSAAGLPTAANLRVWDVPAAGGFLLTDDQEDVRASFQAGEEVAIYRDAAEAAELARYYLARPERRQAMARRAFLRVEQAHRYRHRLGRLYQIMRGRFR